MYAGNLGNLLKDLEETMEKNVEELREYMFIEEVSNFVKRRSRDLQEFKKIVRPYSLGASIYEIHQELREHYPRKNKFYSGICMKGADYFKITKKVEKALKIEIYEELYNDEEHIEEQPPLTAEYCIPSEMSDNEIIEIFG